jgi:glutamate racemase
MPHRPIGIFDSGLGGLTVASELCARLPDERIVYLGDTARVPYGTKSAQTVVQYAKRNMQFLRAHKVKAVVVACNTVSAQGVENFTQPGDPTIIGVITPGAHAAIDTSQSNRIAVLATPGTIASNAYPEALQSLKPNAQVRQVACPLFVPLAEEGWIDHQVTRLVVETYLTPLVDFTPDTLILGCTHYPILQNVIESVAHHLFGSNTQVVNSAKVVARTVASKLGALGLLSQNAGDEHRFFATDVSDRSQTVAQRFWSQQHGKPPHFSHVDLPNLI